MYSRAMLLAVIDTRDRAVERAVELGWNPFQKRWPKGSGDNSGEWKDDGKPNKRPAAKKATTRKPAVTKAAPKKAAPKAAPKAAGGSTALGTPVSQSPKFHKSLSPKSRANAQRAMDAIDKVHGDGVLPRLTLTKSYSEDFEGQVSVRGQDDLRKSIMNVSDTGDVGAFAITHEMGHWIDGAGLAKRTGKNTTDGFGTAPFVDKVDPAIQKVLTKIGSSSSIKKIKEISDGVNWNDDRSADLGVYTEYLLDPREQFARAYSQWIALRSGDPELKKQMAKYRAGNKIPHQWEDDEFEGIAKAFDTLFKSKGWMK